MAEGIMKAGYKKVYEERGLSNLIPGDRVAVCLSSEKYEWMVYAGMSEGNLWKGCKFVEIPKNYKRDGKDQDGQMVGFDIWSSMIKYLQFSPNGQVNFDSFHIDHRAVEPNTDEHKHTASLVDMLQQQ